MYYSIELDSYDTGTKKGVSWCRVSWLECLLRKGCHGAECHG